MPITDVKKRKIGRELTDWIYLGVCTGARRSTEIYRDELATRPAYAKEHLTRAVNMPRRARDRITTWMADYDAKNGSGTGQAFLVECLTLAGTATLGELNAALANYEDIAQAIINNNIGGDTLDQVATAIETQCPHDAKDWVFPLSGSYSDIALLDN